MAFSLWAHRKTTQFPPSDPARAIAVLPLAATEQHGPHLPLGTDFMIAEGMLREVAARCPASLDASVLPVLDIGKSNEHVNFPGTLSYSARTMLSMLDDIMASVARAGYRKLVLVNAHGGNSEVMGIAALEAREKHAMLAVQCSWRRFGLPEGIFSAREASFGIHGGDYETSLMLHFQPDLVEMARARDFAPTAEKIAAENTHLRLTGPLSMGWMAEDNHPEGVAGEAHLATAAKGIAAATHQAKGFIALLEEVARFPLP
jgi:creatinine amidohydrolase